MVRRGQRFFGKNTSRPKCWPRRPTNGHNRKNAIFACQDVSLTILIEKKFCPGIFQLIITLLNFSKDFCDMESFQGSVSAMTSNSITLNIDSVQRPTLSLCFHSLLFNKVFFQFILFFS
jgi:hypothetical protein